MILPISIGVKNVVQNIDLEKIGHQLRVPNGAQPYAFEKGGSNAFYILNRAGTTLLKITLNHSKSLKN